jgi:hypothetical protein
VSPDDSLVLKAVLRVMQPLARLLVRQGLGYTALVAPLKRVFLDAAAHELRARGMPRTDSALSLLSGVHRRDVRQLTRGPEAADDGMPQQPLSVVAQVVARWLAEPALTAADGSPRTLARSGPAPSFDGLVATVSRDVRPRAVLDEMLRLGVAEAGDEGVRLARTGMAPRADLEPLSQLFADNLRDHIAAAAANLRGERNLLEQAIWVDELTAESAEALHATARRAWRQAYLQVMAEAQRLFDADAAHAAPEARRHRARFGVYHYDDRENPP